MLTCIYVIHHCSDVWNNFAFVHGVITIMLLKRWQLDADVRYANHYVDIETWSDDDDDDNDNDDDDDDDDDK